MKIYLKIIKFLQQFFLGISIIIMLALPIVLALYPEGLSEETVLNLYDISHVAVFFVMTIRPLADIFSNIKWIRPLVILRKGVGVLAASVVVSVIFSKLIVDPLGYLSAFGTTNYWSLHNYALVAHLADISAILLIVTSNNLSKKILGAWWKRIQRLSYVFFYASSLYVFLTFGKVSLLYAMGIVTFVTVLAYFMNKKRKNLKLQTT